MTFLVQAASTQHQAACRSLVSCSSQAVNATLGLKFHHNYRIVSEQARGNLNPLPWVPQYLGLLSPEHPETKLQIPCCSRAVGERETRILPTCQMFLQLTLPPASSSMWHVPLCSFTGTGHLLPGMLRQHSYTAALT